MNNCTNFGRFVGVFSAGINDPWWQNSNSKLRHYSGCGLRMWINQKATGPVCAKKKNVKWFNGLHLPMNQITNIDRRFLVFFVPAETTFRCGKAHLATCEIIDRVI